MFATTARTLLWLLAVLGNLLLTALIVVNSLPYFDLSLAHAFILDKGWLGELALWRAALYFHIAGSLICLLTGPLLLSTWTLRRSVATHRAVGKLYCFCTLFWAAPSGLLLAIAAKGGALGVSGFLALGLAWSGTTWLGLAAVWQRRMREHVAWMCRSYALAHSAISFRVFYIALDQLGCADGDAYVGALWLSLLASLALGELLIWLTRARATASLTGGR